MATSPFTTKNRSASFYISLTVIFPCLILISLIAFLSNSNSKPLSSLSSDLSRSSLTLPTISTSEPPISAVSNVTDADLTPDPDGGDSSSAVGDEIGGGDLGVADGGGDGGGEGSKCNLYEGRWEKDDEGRHPLYAPGSCPHVDDAYTCHDNGRQDLEYLKWRWRPNDCELPRFNGTDFLERLRGKHMVLIGDSMNRNQFESMLCVLREALPDKSKMYETRGYALSKGRGYFIFRFVDYECTVEFVRSHFLVREGKRPSRGGSTNPILEIDQIDKSANRWKKANILIFNTGHWWNHGKTAKGKNYFKEGGILYPQLDVLEAFKRAMKTWGRWIDENINPSRCKVFYRGYSAAHFRGGDWDSGGTCNGETEPAVSGAIIDSYPPMMKIVEAAISEMKTPVILLNVTKLTNSRKDGHPSVYRKGWTPGLKVSGRNQDCSHWCLPGVPDAWNELIYGSLVLG